MIRRNRDMNILKFIEDYNCLTISQCAKIFYKNHKFAYDEARKKLKTLENNNFIKHYTFPNTHEYIYCFNKSKSISYHQFTIFNFYAELCSSDAKILYYQGGDSFKFSTGKRCDAYFEVQFNNKIIPLILEIDFTHNTNIAKYEDIYNTNELQESFKSRFGNQYNNIFPLVIIISYSTSRQYDGFIKYKLLPFNFNGLLTNILLTNDNCIHVELIS